MDSIRVQLDSNPDFAWAAWGNQPYKTSADVVGELVDNSKQAKSSECRVTITKPKEGEKRLLTIEDNGDWGVINSDILRKCFGYGKDKHTVKKGLNEHNCGLKQALAYTDPANANWVIQIKQGDVVYQLNAPYSHTIEFFKKSAKDYMGVLKDKNCTFIQTLLDDTQFKTLYHTTVPGKPNADLLIKRMEKYLATFWMMDESVIKREFKIYLNGEYVEPYDIKKDPNVSLPKNSLAPKTVNIYDGIDADKEITIEIWALLLSNRYNKTDHPVYKRNPGYAGATIFKHGRLIKTSIYQEIFQKLPDHEYSGNVFLVNITGESDCLPATHTTKNDFTKKDPKLEKLYQYIKDNVTLISQKDHGAQNNKCEVQLLKDLRKIKEKYNERAIKKGEYKLETEYMPDITINSVKIDTKERIDMLEWNTKDKYLNIIEGKTNYLTSQHLRQLYVYYRNLKHFSADFKGYTIEATFIVMFRQPTDTYTNELALIQHLDPEFCPKIETFEDYSVGLS
jgi:hypothetical protein